MATFYMKLGKLHVEKSKKGDALNFALEGAQGDGFFSLPLTARSALRAAGTLGATLAVRGMTKKLRKITHVQKDAQNRQKRMLKGYDPGRALKKRR
ncbi:MAG: hypothetical protein E7422_01180 [Ruminococcaceae bacterium]|nr:hypothetical protein [Oscillospiraceae bacterium]